VLPVLLNLSGKLVVIVGAGAVGLRKLTAVIESGATVRLIDPRSLLNLPANVTHVAEAYREEHLDDAALAFACATSEVNAQVVAGCHTRGIWVNAATSPAEGDFLLPAVVRRGELTLAVSTGGASPALARRIREKLEAEFDDAFAEWVRVLAVVRTEVLAKVADESRRRVLLDSFAEWSWLERLRSEGADAALTAMRDFLKDL
jgi:precorrin-2 dehydrogenase/sirohydrochlorin ferrochelatase